MSNATLHFSDGNVLRVPGEALREILRYLAANTEQLLTLIAASSPEDGKSGQDGGGEGTRLADGLPQPTDGIRRSGLLPLILSYLYAHLQGKAPHLSPWLLVAGALIALYLMSPVDVIPDAVPIVGILDDLIVTVIGYLLWRQNQLVPFADWCRRTGARDFPPQVRPTVRQAAERFMASQQATQHTGPTN
ncbi:MAG: YkvA family protein [Anaerolineae bacterium]